MFSTRFSRLILSLFVLACMLWLGISIARLAVGYDAFIPGTAVLKNASLVVGQHIDFDARLHQKVLLQTIWLYTNLGMWTIIAYSIAAVSGIFVMWHLRAQYRKRGWLMMSAILFVILIPAQLFLIDADLLLWSFFDYTTGMPLAQPDEIVSVFASRFSNQAIGITTSLVLLSSITIVLLTTLRPLHHTPTDE